MKLSEQDLEGAEQLVARAMSRVDNAEIVVEARPVPDLAEPEPWRATTDAEGKFAFDTLPPGPITVRCAPQGYAASVVDAIAPQADVPGHGSVSALLAAVDTSGVAPCELR